MLVPLPPTMDSPKEFCFCGRKTVESHEFLFCSTNCARQDTLRSLGGPHCHYRNIVRRAYVQAGAPQLGPQPRRMASAAHLRLERPRFENAPPLPQQRNADLADIAPWTKFEKYVPAPAQPTHPSKGPSRTPTGLSYSGSRQEQFSNPFPNPLPNPLLSLRRVISAADGSSTKRSPVAALLNFGRSRKDKEKEKEAKKTEVVFDYPDEAARKKAFRKGGYF